MHTNNSTQHTPTPWRTNGATITARGAWDLTIASCRSRQDPANAHPGLAAKTTAEADANAAFIVRAVNSHADLVAALEVAESALFYVKTDGEVTRSPTLRDVETALVKVRQSLAKLST